MNVLLLVKHSSYFLQAFIKKNVNILLLHISVHSGFNTCKCNRFVLSKGMQS